MQLQPLRDIKLVAFDADDTLWDCQGHFNSVEKAYCELLSSYGSNDEISASLFSVETANMASLGYGSKAFTLSMIENAVKISGGRLSNDQLLSIINLGKSLLNIPATPLPGVVKTLQNLRARHCYSMVVFTKGDNLEQEGKLIRSGLSGFFKDVIVVSDKTKREYTHLCNMYDTDINHLCMVGNSFKSDIAPVLQLGGYAIYIPYKLVWKHEESDIYRHSHLREADHIEQIMNLL